MREKTWLQGEMPMEGHGTAKTWTAEKPQGFLKTWLNALKISVRTCFQLLSKLQRGESWFWMKSWNSQAPLHFQTAASQKSSQCDYHEISPKQEHLVFTRQHFLGNPPKPHQDWPRGPLEGGRERRERGEGSIYKLQLINRLFIWNCRH